MSNDPTRNNAESAALSENQEDQEAFEDRKAEPEISYEDLLKDLKVHAR